MIKSIILYGTIIIAIVGYVIYSEYFTAKLIRKNSELELSIESYKSSMAQIVNKLNAQTFELNKYYSELQTNKSKVTELEAILAEHDLEYLSLKKPELVEKRVNDATKKLLQEIDNETSIP